jgi:hypothetical protein
MRSRRFAAVVAGVAATLLAGVATASAEPATDTSDRSGVGVARANAAEMRAAAVDPVPSEFVPISPVRVLDTRDSGIVGPGGVVTVDLSGRTPASATAVVLNVTGTVPTASTFVTVYPSDEPRPVVSNLNLAPGQTRANAVVVALSADRRVSLFNNSGGVHLIADLAGYYTTDLASLYNTVSPQRVLDTRSTGAVGPRGVVNVDLSFLPAAATAVTFNLTGVGATASTFATAFPTGQPVPVASNINLSPGEVVPNQVTVQLGTNRRVSLYNFAGNTHLIVDLAGYYSSAAGDHFVPVAPSRELDTRVPQNGQPARPLDPSYFLALTGWGPDITALAGNVTGVNATASTFVAVWPGGQSQPGTSTLNLVRGQVAANAVTVGVGFESHPDIDDYSINFANNAGSVHVLFDMAGFFVNLG